MSALQSVWFTTRKVRADACISTTRDSATKSVQNNLYFVWSSAFKGLVILDASTLPPAFIMLADMMRVMPWCESCVVFLSSFFSSAVEVVSRMKYRISWNILLLYPLSRTSDFSVLNLPSTVCRQNKSSESDTTSKTVSIIKEALKNYSKFQLEMMTAFGNSSTSEVLTVSWLDVKCSLIAKCNSATSELQIHVFWSRVKKLKIWWQGGDVVKKRLCCF